MRLTPTAPALEHSPPGPPRLRLSRLAVVAVVLSACDRRGPPTPAGSPSVALPDVLLRADAAGVRPAMAITGASPESPWRLPQTRDAPHASTPQFEERAAALWLAIAKDDPDLAASSFFPEAAYEQVKDVANPSSDWTRRLYAAFARDIHALHGRLGENAARARLVALDVPEERARWVEPGKEYNKIGYYRVFGSKLRFRVEEGPEQSFDVQSLISWRGEWYVVHLSSFK